MRMTILAVFDALIRGIEAGAFATPGGART